MLPVVLESTRSVPSCDLPGRYQCAVALGINESTRLAISLRLKQERRQVTSRSPAIAKLLSVAAQS